MSSHLANPFGLLSNHTVIAGFGVPGRAVAEHYTRRGIDFVVIELNSTIVQRNAESGIRMIQGNVTDETVLRQAGIERAGLLAITVPDDAAALTATELARKLNPGLRIITRCAFTSAGMEALRRGADQTVVAEQVVASVFLSLLSVELDADKF